MGRWLERLWFLAFFSLVIHLGALAAMKRFVSPPTFAFGPGPSEVAPSPLIIPARDPAKPPVEPEVRVDESELFGEKSGDGQAISSLDLPGQMQSEKPQDFEQAWQRQNPVLAAESEPEQASKRSSALVPSGIQTELPTLMPRPVQKGDHVPPAAREDRPADETASDGKATKGEEGEEQQTKPARQANAAESDPAPAGESDVDPFAEAEGISLVGGVKARQGREIKFTRPRVDLAFRAEFTRLQIRKMSVGFRVSTDSTGRPRHVEILRSSGSEQIDESLKLAIYASWFGGKMPDEFLFAIRFYDE